MLHEPNIITVFGSCNTSRFGKKQLMESTRNIIRDLAIEHCDGEGDWQCVTAPAGDDDD